MLPCGLPTFPRVAYRLPLTPTPLYLSIYLGSKDTGGYVFILFCRNNTTTVGICFPGAIHARHAGVRAWVEQDLPRRVRLPQGGRDEARFCDEEDGDGERAGQEEQQR